MNEERGFAYCGLACCLCREAKDCPGCRQEGCHDKEWCQSFQCCQKQNLKGCWECQDFPCDNHMLNKLRVRTFAKFIGIYGEEKLLECLKRNEENGVVYHYQGSHIGDYDQFETEEEIMDLIMYGVKEYRS